jgi:type IV secretory pathway VirB10-like protein
MKILVLIAGVLALGIALVLLALTFQQPELQAEKAALPEQKTETATSTPVTSNTGAEPQAEQQVEVIAVVQPASQAAEQPLTATQQACLELEKRQLEDVQDAESRLDDAREEYEDAKETYDDVLENRDHDDAHVAKIRAERDAAKEEMDDAEKARDNAIRKLSRTRIECNLYS